MRHGKTNLVDGDIWPVPCREEDVTVVAVTTVWIGVLRTRTVPRGVGKTVDSTDLEEGEQVALVLDRHSSYASWSIRVMRT